MEALWQDLRHGFRLLLKSRVFALGALLALALGIGANTAIFSVVDGILFRQLPYDEADRLVRLYEENLQLNRSRSSVSPANFVDWKARSRAFEGIAAIAARRFNLTGGEEPEQILAMLVTFDFFSVLRARPTIGRPFRADEFTSPGAAALGVSVRRGEENAAGPATVILSYGLWQRRFGGKPEAIESEIELDARRLTVIGIMPRDFAFTEVPGWPGKVECWIPQSYRENENPRFRYLNVIARLEPRVSLDRAQAEIQAIARQLEEKRPKENRGWRATVVPLRESLVGDARRQLLVLWGAVGFVMLIACANTANLLLARATARQREIAVRAAIGASRRRLIQQLLTEGTLLAVAAGVAGFILAVWGIKFLISLAPENLPRLDEIRIDLRVFGFTMLLSLITGSMAGILPALRLSKTDFNTALKEGGPSSGRERRWLGNSLVVCEIALALVLLIGAGLLLRSFLRLEELNLGFNPKKVLTIGLNLQRDAFRNITTVRAFYRNLLERIETIPDVDSAAAGQVPLMGVAGWAFQPAGNSESIRCDFDAPSPHYFRALQIPLLKGRTFTEADTEGAPAVAVLNRAAADRAWPGEDPIGKRITFEDPGKGRWITVIGVAENVRMAGLELEPRPNVYLPLAQSRYVTPGNLVIRTKRAPIDALPAVRSAIRSLDKDMPLSRIATMEQRLSGAMAPRRFNFLLIGTFSALALMLATVGVYGIVAYNVTRRTHEIGVRIALGAQKNDILRLILGEGALLFLIGEGFGLAAAYAMNRTIASMLFGITPTDPTTYTMMSLLWATVVLLACYIPARRAADIDPVVSLRHE